MIPKDKHKNILLDKICYTELVYGRINKKLNCNYSKGEIENMIYKIIEGTNQSQFQERGKNIYVTNHADNIKITINSNTFRIITVDMLVKTVKKKLS